MIFRWVYAAVWLLMIGAARLVAVPKTKLHRLLVARKQIVPRIAAFRTAVPGKLFWFHVASAGELEQAIPLMEAVRRQNPEVVIFLSFFSPSAESAAIAEGKRRAAQSMASPWDYADYLGWDLPWTVRRYNDALQPTWFVSMHAELWPVLFDDLNGRNVPIGLGAMYLPRAAKLPLYRRLYLKKALQLVSRIASVDVRTAHALQSMLPEKDIQILGDPRIDRVIERALRNPLAKAAVSFAAPEVVLASLHKADFAALHFWFVEFAKTPLAARVWIVPHEPKETLLQFMESELASWGLSSTRASVAKDSQVVLVDSVGQLAELYARASIAFIGGSFEKAIHNVLEPAAYGVAIVAGPRLENSCEACEMVGAGALIQTDSPVLLCEALQALLKNELYRTETGKRAKSYLIERRGVGDRYGKWLQEWVS
jgi:3-deoxy-D-manno-octulosonic-acid transferase